MRAVSPDGAWVFEDGVLRRGELAVTPFEIDFFERWTFARFMPGGELVLAFESSQPYSEHGSYGNRLWGIEVLAPKSTSEWITVGLEYDDRRHDEQFEPRDVCWSPHGVLAWLDAGHLHCMVLQGPRGEVPYDLLPDRDSDDNLAFEFERTGSWHTLGIRDRGRLLTAADDEGIDLFDLERRRTRRGGGSWESLEVWEG